MEFNQLASSVVIELVEGRPSLKSYSDQLELIGVGRSAFVFKITKQAIAIKVYFPQMEDIAKVEAANYQRIQGNPYYPHLYDYGDAYIVIDYIEGFTLFQCLEKGIHIKAEHIESVQLALRSATEAGLKPSDIHLRNIMIDRNGNIKLIDIARFDSKNADKQWTDLQNAYYRYYTNKWFPKKIPTVILNFIADIYKKRFLPLSVRKVIFQDKNGIHV
ncbi:MULTISPECIES: protein kinase family protein [Cytobacillus]|uniref:Protein kinase family protein n=1 Tax=Cytobacillus stercorigallinarum TaxID=2762240 RepID=A0ABR8QTY4_9BACI|nr:protein kinase family protein [Cytobacillus stercorigallinarum]MBD7938995.1 protein kinase family protein [Cytobacillus stercorigallinarum]